MIEDPTSQIKHPNIRLIATDIDGTLLNSRNHLPPRNHAALKEALARNVRLTLVTARRESSTFAVADSLGLRCACIAHNGARIWDWERRELRHLRVELDLAREIVRFADHHGIPLVLTVDEMNYYSATYPFNPGWRAPDDRIVDSCLDALHAPPTRIIAAGNVGVEQLHAAFGSASDSLVVHRYYSREGSVASAVVTHPRATKEDALAELTRQVGIAAANVLALGDAEADTGMLAWAGVGVAMGNAMPEARAAADWIAPTHDDGGFAAAVERFVLCDDTRRTMDDGQ